MAAQLGAEPPSCDTSSPTPNVDTARSTSTTAAGVPHYNRFIAIFAVYGNGKPMELRTVMVCDDPEAMAQAALAGICVAVLPLPHAQAFLRSGALVDVLPGWTAPGRAR